MGYAQGVPGSRPADGPTDGYFYTNRCGSGKVPGCNRAITKLEIIESMGINPKRRSVCPCGCNSFRSSNFKWWEELLTVRSWRMWLAMRRGELAPPPTAEDVAGNRMSMIRQVMALDNSMPGEDS